MFRDVPEYSMFLVLSTDMQISFEMSDSYVNTLNMADFNLILRAIQGDINWFKLIHVEWFIKVRNLLWCAF